MKATIEKPESNGIMYISEILKEIAELYNSQQKKQAPYYELPRFIYRGISKFYPYWGINENEVSSPTIEDVENGYIRSGLSVKLHKNSEVKGETGDELAERGYIRINYLNSLENMIMNVKKHYPERYDDSLNDLDILADIQHNGGATCLVDFSKNVLTALWFACNADPKDDGFVYCYDIMEDMIVHDNLIVLNSGDESLHIRELLLQTHKETNISSDITARFCLWEPTPNNSRITRQDSVFLFGIEKFHVKNHGVKVIKIPANKKRCILYAMKGLFNITGNSIYNDPIGFASINGKFSPDHRLSTDPYYRGYFNMIRGCYASALDYLKLWEGNNQEQLSDRKKLELCFSLAVCYKKLSSKVYKDTSYYENAIIEYDKVVSISRKILGIQNLSDDDRTYYQTKCTRAMNGIMDLLLELKRYSQAIDYCDTIIQAIDNGCLKRDDSASNSSGKQLNPRYCKIEKMELLCLDVLTRNLANDERNSYMRRMERFHLDAISHHNNSFFDKLLIAYYKFVFDVVIEKGKHVSKKQIPTVNKWKKAIQDNNAPNKYENYISWNFVDIKQLIDEMDEIKYGEKKRYLLNATAYMISFRDEFEMQSWGRSVEM